MVLKNLTKTKKKRIFKIKFKIFFNIVLRQESEMRKLTNAHF